MSYQITQLEDDSLVPDPPRPLPSNRQDHSAWLPTDRPDRTSKHKDQQLGLCVNRGFVQPRQQAQTG